MAQDTYHSPHHLLYRSEQCVASLLMLSCKQHINIICTSNKLQNVYLLCCSSVCLHFCSTTAYSILFLSFVHSPLVVFMALQTTNHAEHPCGTMHVHCLQDVSFPPIQECSSSCTSQEPSGSQLHISCEVCHT